jgi:hypothetical protein
VGGGGANRNRTDDLLNAIQALSQLSYGPALGGRGIDAVVRSYQPLPWRKDAKAGAWLETEGQATGNGAAFAHWLRAVHGVRIAGEVALRAWAAAAPDACEAALLAFAGPDFTSARLAAGLLLEADLRPDDRLFATTRPPWLDQALRVSGPAASFAEATVLVADLCPAEPPKGLRVVILTGDTAARAPPGLRVTRPGVWDYPSESIAD